MFTVCILPGMANPDNYLYFSNHLFSVENIKQEQSDTTQCSCDGVWLCVDGKPKRDKTKKEMLNVITMQTATPAEITEEAANPKGLVKEYDAFIPHPTQMKYYFHPKSGITQADIDAQSLRQHRDYGNGLTDPYEINEKGCCLLVLEDGASLTAAQKTWIGENFPKTEDIDFINYPPHVPIYPPDYPDPPT